VAHGALIVGYTSAASTRILQDFDRPMVSVGYDRIRFLKPVYFEDTLTIDYEITGIVREKERTVAKIEVKNQRDELVAVLTHIMQLVS
jgi:3-hydroxybutyryl-CoA dehydratase